MPYHSPPLSACLFACLWALPTLADSPKIEAVDAQRTGATWRFAVTLSHPDTGWGHYADGWRVLDMQGTELGLRPLAHPHEHEQPFTRSLGNVTLPKGTTQVQIQARCLLDGWAQETVVVRLE
ncbi:hypothetical protein [Pseudophaeobacter profundi]|jgi:hypothetical protein|uniref:hypothetical protein n=1 Tax=Pseudophaeobacter profundi TaxID=3034152 RepID=UPI00242E440C|nr:hypothetical protein [Pseudophaeobacter profundi]